MERVKQDNSGTSAVQLGVVHGDVIIFQCPYGAAAWPAGKRARAATLARMLALLAAVAAVAAPAWAVNKCTGPDGKVSFQDAPCATTAGKAEVLQVRPAAGQATGAPPSSTKPQAPAGPEPQAGAAAPPAPAAPQRTTAQIEADQCLDWYRPKLRDPAGAYYREPSKEGRVLSITVHATNGYGGYVTKPAACEFINGRLDNDWTKIHAKRRNWAEN